MIASIGARKLEEWEIFKYSGDEEDSNGDSTDSEKSDDPSENELNLTTGSSLKVDSSSGSSSSNKLLNPASATTSTGSGNGNGAAKSTVPVIGADHRINIGFYWRPTEDSLSEILKQLKEREEGALQNWFWKSQISYEEVLIRREMKYLEEYLLKELHVVEKRLAFVRGQRSGGSGGSAGW
ncbi:hypothetical protein HDU76_002413 [Blyttiomyces sp. JEL0837]|nr:hypothetical protein HDU76_002413 [Blyttiomyces sp. JEL0837]